MSYEFTLPDVGEGITESDLLKWHVKPGDVVREDDVLCEIETDKAVVEIPVPCSGTVQSLHAAEGSTVKVGSVIAVFDTGATAQAAQGANEAVARAAASAAAAAPAGALSGALSAVSPAPTFSGWGKDRSNTSRLWILDKNNKPRAISVSLGLTDGSMTEIIVDDPQIKADSEVIVGMQSDARKKPAAGAPGPRMF